jgi:hypothetical protein
VLAASPPPVTSGYALATDPIGGRVLMFGGINTSGQPVADPARRPGAANSRRHPPCPARHGDQRRQRSRARPFQLKHSGIALQLSSMASFRPDGQLFEGNGVPPDVVCEPKATDFVGTTDTALELAQSRLK